MTLETPSLPSSVLLVRLCCLGDLVFCTPLLRSLRARLPQARLGLVVGTFAAPLLEGTNLVDEIVLLKAPWVGGRIDTVARAAALMAGLRGRGWDTMLVGHRSVGIRALCALSGIHRRIGYRWNGDGRFLTDPVDYDAEIHETARHLSLLGPLGLEPVAGGLAFPVSARARADGDALLHAHGLQPGGYAVVMPGGGRNPGMAVDHKRWSLEGYRTIARQLVARGLRVVFVGDQADRAVCAQVADSAGSAGVNLCGRTSLAELTGLLASAQVVCGNDSGPLHLAEAVGTPTLGLYGPTSPRHYGPLVPGHITLYAGIHCSPCLNPAEGLSIVCRQCPRNRCMEALSTEQALSALETLLAR